MDTDYKEYLKTGMLGAYHPKRAIRREMEGKVYPLYRDTVYTETEHGIELTRNMIVGGKTFLVRSIFPSHPTATPTQAMLKIIDENLKK